MKTLAARAAFNKEVIVLKLSSFSRNVKQNRRKNWRLGKYFLGIKNNTELNRWTKKISYLQLYFEFVFLRGPLFVDLFISFIHLVFVTELDF